MDTTITDRISRLEHTVGSAIGTDNRGGWIQRHFRAASDRIDSLDEEITGGKSGFGIRTRVKILWHSHTWVILIIGNVIGAALMKLFGM